ncbi:MAG: sulfotransferase [Limnoraphis sp.]
MNEYKQRNLAPIFIVSSGRAGTTLLRGILNASNQIYFPHESDFIARAYPFYKDKQSLTEEDYQFLVKLFIKNSQKSGWGMTEEYLLSYLKQQNCQTLAEVQSDICQAYFEQEHLKNLQWGIKTPVLIFHLDQIRGLFPDAKIIHMVRDGRDVILSYKKVHQTEEGKAKFGPSGIITGAFYWIDGIRRIERFKSDRNIYEFTYCDLVTDSDNTLEKLFHFLNLKYDPSIPQKYYQAKQNKDLLLSSHKKTIHAKIYQGIDSNNIQKFKDEMSSFDQLIFELIGSSYLEKYDYPIQYPWTSWKIFTVLRQPLYFVARQFNNWRYHRRDLQRYQRVKNQIE